MFLQHFIGLNRDGLLACGTSLTFRLLFELFSPKLERFHGQGKLFEIILNLIEIFLLCFVNVAINTDLDEAIFHVVNFVQS